MGVPADPGGRCPVCGFKRDLVEPADVAPRVSAAVDEFARLLSTDTVALTARPEPMRWSVLEYGSHLRDVLIALRERTLTAAVEDTPTGVPIHRDERVALGAYRLDDPATVAHELRTVAALFVRTTSALPPGALGRRLVYSPVSPVEVTVEWLGTQAVHESEHHLLDARDNLARLGI
ncbi:MAG TPA: DinB family protein [Acidimicrobiales bacterium]|nr:DinB family protein [Acidimicrobiales bacterium]